jgi:DNA-binding MarR family transcriptional regulator
MAPTASIAPSAAPELGEFMRAAELRSRLRRFVHESERIAAEHGLTPRRYLLLLLIKAAPDGSEVSTVSELARRMALERHTVTELVDRAERAGLIERERSSDDRRVVHLRLTGEGERRLLAAFRDLETERRALQELMV